MTVRRLRIIPSALAIVFAIASHAHCGDLVGGWTFLETGVLPTKASYGDMGVPLAFSGRIAGFVVDGSTTPKNPFPGTERAYYLTPGDQNGAVRMIFRPFVDTNPENGYYEFTFRLVEGGFDLVIGEPLTGPNASPVTFPVEKSAFGSGAMSYILTSGSNDFPCAKAFVGGIQVDPYQAQN